MSWLTETTEPTIYDDPLFRAAIGFRPQHTFFVVEHGSCLHLVTTPLQRDALLQQFPDATTHLLRIP